MKRKKWYIGYNLTSNIWDVLQYQKKDCQYEQTKQFIEGLRWNKQNQDVMYATNQWKMLMTLN